MPAPYISNFGDENHQKGEASLVIDGFDLGFFEGEAWMYANADRSGAADQLTVGAWTNQSITGVEIPGTTNNAAGTVYLFVQRFGDLAWNVVPYQFTLSEAGGYITTAEAGSFAISGTAATLKKTSILDTGVGSIALTGAAASLLYGRRVDAGSGSIALTGTAVSLERGYVLGAEAGSFAVAGSDASLIWSGSAGYTLDAEAGAFTITGFDAYLSSRLGTAGILAALSTWEIEPGMYFPDVIKYIAAATAGKLAGAGTNSVGIDAIGNPGTRRIDASVDSKGNRTTVTLTP